MSPLLAYLKCKNQKKRISELETIIANDPQTSYYYAKEIINDRFIISEKIIAKDMYYSFLYAQHVIKGPFHLCHPIIFNSSFKDDYILFLKSINYDLNEITEWLI